MPATLSVLLERKTVLKDEIAQLQKKMYELLTENKLDEAVAVIGRISSAKVRLGVVQKKINRQPAWEKLQASQRKKEEMPGSQGNMASLRPGDRKWTY